MERFEDFIEERRIVLAEELNRFLSGITISNLDEGVVEIDDLIAEGEHNGLGLCQVNPIHSKIPVNCRCLLYAISMA